MNQSNKALRDDLKAVPILKNSMITPNGDILPTNYNLTDEDVDQILALVTNHIKGKLDDIYAEDASDYHGQVSQILKEMGE